MVNTFVYMHLVEDILLGRTLKDASSEHNFHIVCPGVLLYKF